MRRVVISGIGLIGPTGIGPEAFWTSLVERRSGIDRITRFDPTSYPCQIGGEVRDTGYESLIEPQILRVSTHVTRMALGAAELALRHARMPARHYQPFEIGVTTGTALGGWRDAEQQYGILLARGARRVNPFVSSGAPHNGPGAEIAGAAGAQGAQVTFSTGCPAALQAIAHAAVLVASGELEMCIAGGAESPLSPMVIAGMGRTRELSMRNDAPQDACRPFDREHGGIVLSEGACFLILESAEAAASRGADVYAEILGGATSCDAGGLYGLDPSGEAGARAVHRTLSRAGVEATEIDYVCSHANSSPGFDRKETLVLKKAMGECTARTPVSSIKGVMGHAFGASGAFQVAAASLAIRHETIPPTHNLVDPDPECDLAHVAGSPRRAAIRHALVTSYGYGGVNSYLLLRRPKD